MRFRFPVLALAALTAGAALGGYARGGAPAAAPAVTGGAGSATSPLASVPISTGNELDPTAIEKSVNPCDDFYQYACGGWLAKTEIPGDRPSWDRAFSVIQEANEKKLREILEHDAAGKRDPADPYAKRAGDFYAACMDEKGIEKAGTKPLAAELAPIADVKDIPSLANAVARYQREGVGVLFELGQEQDYKDATQVIAYFDQGGLGLPDRDYYVKDDPATKKIQASYLAHVQKMLELGGIAAKDAAAQAAIVVRVETELAKASMTRADRRDPQKTYHRLNLTGLEGLAPAFPWKDTLEAIGLPAKVAAGAPVGIDVKAPDFFKAVDALAKGTAPADWQAYLRYHVIAAMAPTLPKRFVDESFHFQQIMTGVKVLRPRWKRCVDATNSAMGMAPARTFVAETFGETGKARGVALIAAIEAAMGGDIHALDWMDPATKKLAEDKLALVANQIGYPDKWRSYDGLSVDRAAYARNAFAANAFEVARQLAKIGKPVDRSDWDMAPPVVNAYYDPSLNQMVFPAGILQPPFFFRDGGLAANFGGIGMVMGHELTHGFDDEGRQFDGHGNMRDWWTKESAAKYDQRAACIVTQYSGYTVAGGVHLNGKLTLGENIADNGGIKLAYHAFEAALAARTADPPEAKSPFTPEQQFFLAYAQSWCGKRRDAYAKLLVTVDPHSPEKYRVNGPLSNLAEFQQAFSCPAGAPMAPKDHCQVW